jgi:hypothetical protein
MASFGFFNLCWLNLGYIGFLVKRERCSFFVQKILVLTLSIIVTELGSSFFWSFCADSLVETGFVGCFFVIIEAMSRFSELKHAASGMVVK